MQIHATPQATTFSESQPARRSFGPPSLINLKRRNEMLWTILVILIILWLLGFALKVGGGLIHLVLVIALIILVVQLITGRRA
jgi:hypothetical protein